MPRHAPADPPNGLPIPRRWQSARRNKLPSRDLGCIELLANAATRPHGSTESPHELCPDMIITCRILMRRSPTFPAEGFFNLAQSQIGLVHNFLRQRNAKLFFELHGQLNDFETVGAQILYQAAARRNPARLPVRVLGR